MSGGMQASTITLADTQRALLLELSRRAKRPADAALPSPQPESKVAGVKISPDTEACFGKCASKKLELDRSAPPGVAGVVVGEDDYGVWRTIPGIPARLCIASSLGYVRVKEQKTDDMVLARKGLQNKGTGYCKVAVMYIRLQVHFLVCLAFRGPPPG